MEKIFLSKSNGETLSSHCQKVYETSMNLCLAGGLDNTEDGIVKRIVGTTAILHDIGKTAPYYQDWIRKGKSEEEDGDKPRHNDVGAAIISAIAISGSDFWEDYGCVIAEAVRNHHYSWNCSDVCLGEIFTEQEMKDAVDWICSSLLHCGYNDDVRLIDEWEDIPVMKPAWNRNGITPGKDIEKMAMYDIAHSIVRYADYMVSAGRTAEDCIREKDFPDMVMPQEFDKERWDKQMMESEELISMCGKGKAVCLDAPTGYGKTVMGLRFLTGGSNRRGYWVLPDNNLAQEVYSNIVDILPRCGMGDVRVSLLIGGEYIKGNENCDIVVTNIDNYTNSLFKNAWKKDSVDRMLCNVIFDEFHKYFTPEGALMSTFISALRGRRHFNGVRTLIMSATGVVLDAGKRYFVNEDDVIIKKVEDSPIYDKRIRINFVEDWDTMTTDGFKESSLVVSTAVSRCQELVADDYFHSRFTSADKENIYRNLRDKGNVPRTLSATNIICEGYDITKNVLYMCNCSPESLIQAGGRINRFDYNNISEYNLLLSKNNRDKAIFRKDVFASIIEGWYKFLKEEYDGKEYITLRELCGLREKFNAGHITTTARKYLSDSIENFFLIPFKRGYDKSTGSDSDDREKRVSKGNTLRGNTNTIFVVARDYGDRWTSDCICLKDVGEEGWAKFFHMTDPAVRKQYNDCMLREMKDDAVYAEKLFKGRYLKNVEKCLQSNDFYLFENAIDKAASSGCPFKIFPFMGWRYKDKKGLFKYSDKKFNE